MKAPVNLKKKPVSPFQRGFALLLLILVLLSGCAAKKAPSPIEKPPQKGYREVLNKWTRGKKVFEGMESRLYFTATYKDPEFRAAYIDRYAQSYQLGDEMRKALLDRETEQSEKFNEFFFAAYTPDQNWNDFDRTNSVWKLYLEDNAGSRLTPVSITKVDPSDQLIREFFPYFDMWSSGYIVKFPKYSEAGQEPIPSANTSYLKLVVTGVLGKGELEWRLKE
ncbi:MAG: hypothetical protein HY893_02600 [Deltaproteobacteria bacterium]|nr:hypothetical protein [Deltaproteobacteria bacterium]